MGPLVTGDHLQRVTACVEKGVKEGATLALDGRSVQVDAAPNGFYLGPTLFDHVRPEMSIATDEIFGPVLSTIRTGDLEEALAFCNRSEFGNAAVMFTQSGRSAREFRHRVNAGMVGINIGVPAPTALFPFAGWNNSFFGDLHVQGQEGVAFFTRQKVTITRW
jgi:malonate-semialdehyde dehydrogenase (acetylating)/methylmalonate-semialdehyde dehydrogenase